jgi:hypothetical protein
MNDLSTLTNSLGAALGIGLLVGLERERKKGEGPKRGPAGLRQQIENQLKWSVCIPDYLEKIDLA